MTKTTWQCSCSVVNIATQTWCEACGEPRPRATTAAPPAYREVQAQHRETSHPADVCSEPGCTKTVAQHIADFRAFGQRIQDRIDNTRSTLQHVARMTSKVTP